MELKTISDVRCEIKKLGFKVKTKSLSWGKHATYFHIESNQELNFSVFTPELLKIWKPLLEWKKENRDSLKVVRENEDCKGLI